MPARTPLPPILLLPLPSPPSPTPPVAAPRRGVHFLHFGALLALTALMATLVPPAQADEFGELRALVTRGEAAAALPRIEKAAAANPRDVQLRFLQGVALMDLQRHAEALDHFSRMAQDYPELPDPHNNIALLHARAGRLEQARQALELALRNDPSHRAARSNLGQVYLMLAVQAWELAAAEGPLDTALLRRLEVVRSLLVAEPEAPRRAAR